ncbi:MAG TPA: Uma2 family endonuclease [Planctomicrobium sp.]|nr:Uma2 family endonuclease [Planctomicrobium sp.]
MQRFMTAQQFIEDRSELPDAGQWAELVRGVPISLPPPDAEHGTVVLNLSKALSEYVHRTLHGYACFDLGLHVERQPDTILFPAVSYFTQGDRFAESDKEATDTVPGLVVELLTTNERRRNINERVGVYLRHGVRHLWLIDPEQQTVHVIRPGASSSQRLNVDDTLIGDSTLPEFKMEVHRLFALPDWAQ